MINGMARIPHHCLFAYLFRRELSAPLRRACFSMLSMDSLLARLAFLQTVWLLSKEKNWVSSDKKSEWLHNKVFLPQHLLSVPLYLNHHSLFIWLSVLLLCHLLQILRKDMFCNTIHIKITMNFMDLCSLVYLLESVTWDYGKCSLHLRWAPSACFEDLCTQWHPKEKSKCFFMSAAHLLSTCGSIKKD